MNLLKTNGNYENFRKEIARWSISKVSKEARVNYLWQTVKGILQIERAEMPSQVKSFVNQAGEKSLEEVNIFSNGEIKVFVDTIHNIKGETHRGTLYLPTKNHITELDQKLIPFLKGSYNTTIASQVRVSHKLKVAYVGLTRATELVCLAASVDELTEDDLKELKENGFEIDTELIKTAADT